MNCNIRLFMKCVGLFAAFTAGSVSCFSAPATARVMNNDVVLIQLEQRKETANISSDLLSEKGQIIYVNDDFEEMVIPITIWGEKAGSSRNIAGKIKAVSSDEEQLLVSLDKEQLAFEDGKSVVQLTMKRLEVETEDDTETEETPETPTLGTEGEPGTEEPTLGTEGEPGSEEPTPGTEGEPGSEEPTPGAEGEPGTEEPTLGTEGEPGTEEPTPGTEEPTPGIEGEPTLGTEGELGTEEPTPGIEGEPGSEEPTPGAEDEPGTEEPTQKTETEVSSESEVNIMPQTVVGTAAAEVEEEFEEEPESENQDEEKETLSSKISFIYGEKTYSATIVIVSQEEKEPVLGELSFCQSQYHPTKLITMIGGKESDCEISGFPVMTKYILEDQTYVLYSGGSITIPAGKEISIDLSETKVKEKLLLTAGSGKTYTIKYAELPRVSKETFPTVINEEGAILTDSEKWGTIEPIIRIEHLTIKDEKPVWEAVESITVEENDEGELQIMPNQAEAGTYRAVVLWNESEVTLEKMEMPFFIQYASVDQGGIRQ